MARAVAFATETSAESSYFLTQRNCGQVTAHTATARQSPGQRFVYVVTMNIQRGQFSVEMITDFQAHLVFDEFHRPEATRPDSDANCIRIAEFACCSNCAERLARLKQVPIQ